MRNSYLIALFMSMTVMAHAADSTLSTLEQKASYSFGADFIKRLEAQGIKLDSKALTRGINDADSGELSLSEEEMAQSKQAYLQQLREELAKKQKAAGEKNLVEGKAFLAANAKKEGVITTASGLQYKIIKPGTGATPTADDTVETHYKGTLIDGREFDSSYKRGQTASFPVKGVIKGWTEALQLMKVGAKWELYIPSDIAYGATKRSELIQPNSTLIFELELIAIK